MADSPLRSGEIDYPRYQRSFSALVGRDCPLRIFDDQGKPVWGPEEAGDAALGRQLVEARQPDEARVSRLALGANEGAFYRPLRTQDSAIWGWATARTPGGEMAQDPVDGERVAEALENVAQGLVREVSLHGEVAQIAEQLAESYEELHLVYSLDQLIRPGVGPGSDPFVQALKSAAEHLDADVVTYVQPGSKTVVQATNLSKPIHNLDLVNGEMGGDLYRYVQASGVSVVLNEAGDARRAYLFTDMPYRILGCPVRTGGKVYALVVMLRHMHKPPFSNGDRHLGEVMANQLANLAKSALLMRSMATFTEQLAAALVEAVEAKDPYTRGHSERVNVLSLEIGKALGLTDSEMLDLHWGSLLHDVGKIGIPDAVLCKPGRLTKDEYVFIKVHPERGHEILRHIDQLKNMLPAVRHHHERFDGKGYPDGLKGERIPLLARIMAVADTYDSITSSRAYRAGRSHEDAIAEMDSVCGTQLDPAMVATFKKICDGEPAWMTRFNIRREARAPG